MNSLSGLQFLFTWSQSDNDKGLPDVVNYVETMETVVVIGTTIEQPSVYVTLIKKNEQVRKLSSLQ